MYALNLNLGKDINRIMLNQMCVIGGTNGFEVGAKLSIDYGYLLTFKSDKGTNFTKLIEELKNVCESYGVDYVSLITDES